MQTDVSMGAFKGRLSVVELHPPPEKYMELDRGLCRMIIFFGSESFGYTLATNVHLEPFKDQISC